MADRGDGSALPLRARPAVLRYGGGDGPFRLGTVVVVDVSRRGFLCALAATPVGRTLFGPSFSAPPPPLNCALPESRAGFAKALAGRETPDILVFPGAAGWDDSIARRVR